MLGGQRGALYCERNQGAKRPPKGGGDFRHETGSR